MINNDLFFKPIGTLRTPFTEIKDMPIQPSGASGFKGTLILDPSYTRGLRDLDGFSHLILLYIFHRVSQPKLRVTPFLDDQEHGVFATRAPTRPNPIGFSIVRLLGIQENVLFLENVDMLNGSPVIDIKPYVPAFDQPENVKTGSLSPRGKEVKKKRSDNRFL